MKSIRQDKIPKREIIVGAFIGFCCGILVIVCGVYIANIPNYSSNVFLNSLYWISIYLGSIPAITAKTILGTFMHEWYAILLSLTVPIYFSILGICFAVLFKGNKKENIIFLVTLLLVHGICLYAF